MSRGAYDPKEDLSPELQQARQLLKLEGKYHVVRFLDACCFAEIILGHVSSKKSVWANSDKILVMRDLTRAYSRVDYNNVAGSRGFISPHFLLFAISHRLPNESAASEEVRADMQRAAKKKGLFGRNANPEPITRQMLEEPATGWRTA
ncbi:hypothetical protein [Methylobacterium sp. CM6257]